MTKLKGKAGATEIFEAAFRGFGIHQQAFGQLGLWLVMIQHQHINAGLPERTDFDGRRCPAIDGDKKLRIVQAKTAGHPFIA